MITIISGVPGSGKTSLVVEMIMAELKTGRKIFTIGIPDLLLRVTKGGDPLTWQDGGWLQIDRFNPVLTKNSGIESQWFPRSCPESCAFLSSCPRIGHERPDAGSLIVIDEAHAYFPQRASGKAPPPFIEAFNVHRHQGLDFWILTQRPAFLDPFLRGLCSRHIHLGLNAFSFTGKRVKYEWTEYQETLNRTSKMCAARTDYRPSPAVFPLYASATIHTKLDQRMPTILKLFVLALCGVLFMAAMVVQRVQAHRVDIQERRDVNPAVSGVPSSAPVPVGPAVAADDDVRSGHMQAVSLVDDEMRISGCIATVSFCRCYTNSGAVELDDDECRATARAPVEAFSPTLVAASSSSAQ